MADEDKKFLSRSIWFSNVDRGFKKMLQSIVKLPNLDGERVPVPVVIRKPEEEFKVDQYPVISIYNLYSRLDTSRYSEFDTITIKRDYESNIIYQSKPSIPFNLQYQIDFWGLYQQDMNEMTLRWLSAVGRDFNLPVVDNAGDERDVYVLMRGDLSKNDIFVGESTSRTMNRLYHWYLTYRVYAYLYEEEYSLISGPMILSTRVTGNDKETQEEIQKAIEEGKEDDTTE